MRTLSPGELSKSLAGKSIFIATPMYGGLCYGVYADALLRMVLALTKIGVPTYYCILYNESHIDRARNVLVDKFLRSPCSHMLFIDSDLSGFEAHHIIDLLDRDKSIICGFYPKKEIDWALVRDAAKVGLADKDPNYLEKCVGKMVYTPAQGADSARRRSIYELVPLHEGGTGFMLVKRSVFEIIRSKWPELTYGPEGERVTAFFDAKVEPGGIPPRRFLTEDYDFCRLCRAAGYTVWLAPWINLTHSGCYQFHGDVEALALAKETENAA